MSRTPLWLLPELCARNRPSHSPNCSRVPVGIERGLEHPHHQSLFENHEAAFRVEVRPRGCSSVRPSGVLGRQAVVAFQSAWLARAVSSQVLHDVDLEGL